MHNNEFFNQKVIKKSVKDISKIRVTFILYFLGFLRYFKMSIKDL